jgi:hypothetical protein
MKQSVEDGAGSGHIAEQFTPFFDGTIGGHHGGKVTSAVSHQILIRGRSRRTLNTYWTTEEFSGEFLLGSLEWASVLSTQRTARSANFRTCYQCGRPLHLGTIVRASDYFDALLGGANRRNSMIKTMVIKMAPPTAMLKHRWYG